MTPKKSKSLSWMGCLCLGLGLPGLLLGGLLVLFLVVEPPSEGAASLNAYLADGKHANNDGIKTRSEIVYVKRSQSWRPPGGLDPLAPQNEELVVYEWQAGGQNWTVEAWVDAGFLAPFFIIREEGDDDAWVSPPAAHTGCFVRGRVRGREADSDAALNTCGVGLRGVIRIGSVIFSIEPMSTPYFGNSPTNERTKNDSNDSYKNKISNSDPIQNNNIFNQNNKKNVNFSDNNFESLPHEDLNLVNANKTYPEERSALWGYLPHRFELLSPSHISLSNIGIEAPSNDNYLSSHDIGNTSEQNSSSLQNDTVPYEEVDPLINSGSDYLDSKKEDSSLTTESSPHLLRPKRFIYSKRHTIEVLVVVDHKMMQYHGQGVDQYVLTLMSVVSLIFRDKSIGHHMDIAVVEVVKPKGKTFKTKKAYENIAATTGESAEEMLKVFCKWQKHAVKHNIDYSRRYDTALLITRENICRNPYTQSCDTLGLAELGTMCSRYASCAIVQDNGLSASFTIAHELGHLLNMPHDNDEKCSLFRKQESPIHMNVMSRMLDHNTLPWIWSNCSQHYLTEYIQAGHTRCLEDEPHTNELSEDDVEFTLAGELFSATQQCQYVFGKTSGICPYMPKCKRLWCTTTLDEKEGCRTQHMPWADGTPCDKNRWCLRGECTPKNRKTLEKISGEWGSWQPWSECSRTCGVGVRRSERFCDSPPPQFGGRFCVGERVRYESCKLRDCPRGSVDFRTQQCQHFNGKNFGLPDIPEDVKWMPKYSGISRSDSCKLFCQVKNSSFYYQLREKVEDGTPCRPDSYDICVSGECRVAGCDYVLNSTLRDDWCGVCNGDNSTCQLVTGSLDDVQQWGYSDVTVIPEGAARIDIYQSAHHDNPADDNYLALVDMETGEYLLNGHWIVTPFEKLVEFGGTVLEYTGSNQVVERVNSTKPLQKKLLVQILSVGELNPPLVQYSFSKSDQHSSPIYSWKLGNWTKCSRPCLGDRERTPFCIRGDTNARVADYYCDQDKKPADLHESCTLSCPVHWRVSDWSKCKLDKGDNCVKSREVMCVTSAGTEVSLERCRKDPPPTEMQCLKEECPTWKYSGWTPCSCPASLYEGVKRRLYACFLLDRPVTEWECLNLPKPGEEEVCPCWYAGDWQKECTLEESETLLELRRKIDEFFPKLHPKLRNRNQKENGSSKFSEFKGQIVQATNFDQKLTQTEVPKQCPRGTKRRDVTCGHINNPQPIDLCDMHHKPAQASSCTLPCTTTTSTTTSTTTLRTIFKSPSHSAKIKAWNPEDSYPSVYPHSTTYNKPSQPDQNSISKPLIDPDVDVSTNSVDSNRDAPPIIVGGRPKGGTIKGGRVERIDIVDPIPEEKNVATPTNDISDSFPKITDEETDYYRKKVTDELPKRPKGPEDESANFVEDYHEHLWQTGGWTQCSRSCGAGEKRRQVVCGGPIRLCPPHLRPPDVSPCNAFPCTEWTIGKWGTCQPSEQNACRGIKYRKVVCRDMQGNEEHPSKCLAADRPQSKATCRSHCRRNKGPHHRYKWRKGPWSPCSQQCDGGDRNRTLTCTDRMAGHEAVSDTYCLRYGRQRPRAQSRCNKFPCPHRWVAGEWAQCSKRCGPGDQTRDVSCHRVNSLGWIDPDPVTKGCGKKKVPAFSRPCNMGPCAAGYFWVARPWKPCQAPCGSKGRQRRSVICVDPKGMRVQRKKCSRPHRPRRKQRCKAPPCGLRTCNEVRNSLGITLDGEFTLYVGGVNTSVYCIAMNTTEPREYLTLPAGGEGNYAEIYSKRLLRPDTCPFNGARRDNCYCVDDESGRAGLTTFNKIRINTTSLVVNTFDFSFAHAASGRLIPYGEAGDCYSMTQCPQGSFSINLVGTPFKVSERTTWRGHGNKATHWIDRRDESQRILGRCGGYCGTCTPDPVRGLKLDIRILKEAQTKKTQ